MRNFVQKQEDGAVAVIVAVAIPVLLGFAGLALEYGQALTLQAQMQRAADLASHAGAVAYGQTGSEAAMTKAAEGVARLNGFSENELSVVLSASDKSPSGQGVRVTIAKPKPLILPRFVGGDTSVGVSASALAAQLAGQASCIQALNPSGNGITMSGSAKILAANCAVASNAEVRAPCGTKIVTETLTYNLGSNPLQCDSVESPNGGAARITKSPTVDPLDGSAALDYARSRLLEASSLAAPAVPAGPNINFAYDQNATKAQAQAIGCDATFTSSPNRWVVSCPNKTTVNIGNLTIGGGIDLQFNLAAGPDVTYNFSGRIYNAGGSTMTFPEGSYDIAMGIDNPGGATIKLGAGTRNNFRIGPGSDGNAITLGGSSQTILGDATNGVFDVVGRIGGGGGGSCLVLPAAPIHKINGSIAASGAVRFGSGVYAVNGSVHIGGNGGGGATCLGRTMSVEAPETSFLISGLNSLPHSGECGNTAFCVSAGYSNIMMTAPQSGPLAELAVIGPLSPQQTRGAKFTAGASGSQVSGVFYFPNGPIAVAGGSSVAGGTPATCLQLIGSEIVMSGGTSGVSECKMVSANPGGQTVLLE